MTIRIREVEPEDWPEVWRMGLLLLEESQYAGLEPDEAHARLYFDAIFQSDDMAGWVAEEDGELVGFLVASRAVHFFSKTTYTIDLSWYVIPEKRGSSAGRRLLKAYLYWSKSGASETYLAVNTGISPERTARLLKHYGFVHSGELFVNKE